ASLKSNCAQGGGLISGQGKAAFGSLNRSQSGRGLRCFRTERLRGAGGAVNDGIARLFAVCGEAGRQQDRCDRDRNRNRAEALAAGEIAKPKPQYPRLVRCHFLTFLMPSTAFSFGLSRQRSMKASVCFSITSTLKPDSF